MKIIENELMELNSYTEDEIQNIMDKGSCGIHIAVDYFIIENYDDTRGSYCSGRQGFIYKGYVGAGDSGCGDHNNAGQSACNNAYGTGLDISTDTFKLDTSTFDVDSAGGGSIALGTTPNTSIAGTNKGIFMSGSGDFLLFGNSSNFFKFDSTGNSIELKTDTFDLDASTLVMKSDSNNVYSE